MGYAFGLVPFTSAGIGAPHIRDRAYWVAHASSEYEPAARNEAGLATCLRSGAAVGLANSAGEQYHQRDDRANERGWSSNPNKIGWAAALAGLVTPTTRDWKDTSGMTAQRDGKERLISCRGRLTQQALEVNGFWRDADWLFCRDGQWRPVESGTFPLVARFAKSPTRQVLITSNGRPQPHRPT